MTKEIHRYYRPESSLAAGQKPLSRFTIRGRHDRYIISDHVWPSAELVLTPDEIDNPLFALKEVINKWKEKELTPESEDILQVLQMVRRLYCEAVEGISSSIAGIRHADRFEVQMRKNSYLVRDQLRPSWIFEISGNELFETLMAEDLLRRGRRETPEDTDFRENSAGQESTRALLKVSLEILLGPEAAILAQMDPTNRFTVRDHNGGFRVFDACNPHLPLHITGAEVK
ncbi:MAG TPA: hypothetical protein VGO47_03450, partial [Chlamydiales bacterium]|nr:hypothetical protein [Chlamydiales bacterium]